MAKEPLCADSRKCFGKRTRAYDGRVHCVVLNETYETDGECPFCKPFCNVTKGQLYLFDVNYGTPKEEE